MASWNWIWSKQGNECFVVKLFLSTNQRNTKSWWIFFHDKFSLSKNSLQVSHSKKDLGESHHMFCSVFQWFSIFSQRFLLQDHLFNSCLVSFFFSFHGIFLLISTFLINLPMIVVLIILVWNFLPAKNEGNTFLSRFNLPKLYRQKSSQVIANLYTYLGCFDWKF